MASTDTWRALPSEALTFGKDESKIVRGFAILTMIVHHVIPLSNPGHYTLAFGTSMKICVGLFTFLVGYGYCFSSDKTVFGGLKRALRLCVEFWTLMLLIFIPLHLIGGGDLTFSMVVNNMFGIKENLHWFSWYVYFYIFAMAAMPFLHNICDKWSWRGLIAIVAASLMLKFCFVVINRTPVIRETHLGFAAISCMAYLPLLVLGYMMGRKRLFSRVPTGARWLALYVCLGILALTASVFCRGVLTFTFDFFYVPLVILALLSLFRFSSDTSAMRRFFITLGDLSMLMWFVHALFVMDYCRVFTGILTGWAEGWWPLTSVVVAFMSFMLAWVLRPVVSIPAKLILGSKK